MAPSRLSRWLRSLFSKSSLGSVDTLTIAKDPMSYMPTGVIDIRIVAKDPISCMPPELLALVIKHLDGNDVACLSLCNKFLYAQIGGNAFDRINRLNAFSRLPDNVDIGERDEFFVRLARDLPKYYYCFNCTQLHTNQPMVSPSRIYQPNDYDYPNSARSRCLRKHEDENLALGFARWSLDKRYILGFQHVQWVMARHRASLPPGDELNSLFYLEARHYMPINIRASVSVEPRIVEEKLYLRVQRCVWRFGDDMRDDLYRDYLKVCPHTSNSYHWNVKEMVRCKLNQAHRTPDCDWCYPLLRCSTCAAEVQCEITEKVMVLTIWYDLGRGSVVPDREWKQQKSSARPRGAETGLDGRILHADPENGIRERFEREPGRTLSEITQLNVSLWENHAFRTTAKKRIRGQEYGYDNWKEYDLWFCEGDFTGFSQAFPQSSVKS